MFNTKILIMTSKANAEKQNGKGTPAMEVKKNTTSKTASTEKQKKEVKQPTVEELQKKVTELTHKLSAVPSDLNSRIEYFNRKRDLIRKLKNLESNVESLQKHLDVLAELSAANEFENDSYVLNIQEGRYNGDTVFKLKNPVLIGEVLTYLIGKAEAKIKELENEIAA